MKVIPIFLRVNRELNTRKYAMTKVKFQANKKSNSQMIIAAYCWPRKQTGDIETFGKFKQENLQLC